MLGVILFTTMLGPGLYITSKYAENRGEGKWTLFILIVAFSKICICYTIIYQMK